MLSERVKKWIKRRLESWVGEYEEGPEPPDRLRLMVLSFAEMHPRATRGEFIDFAAKFAGECYRAGYVRGVEWSERDSEKGDTTPEEAADALDPEWRYRPTRDLELEGVVPEERTEEDALRDHVNLFKRPGKR